MMQGHGKKGPVWLFYDEPRIQAVFKWLSLAWICCMDPETKELCLVTWGSGGCETEGRVKGCQRRKEGG